MARARETASAMNAATQLRGPAIPDVYRLKMKFLLFALFALKEGIAIILARRYSSLESERYRMHVRGGALRVCMQLTHQWLFLQLRIWSAS